MTAEHIHATIVSKLAFLQDDSFKLAAKLEKIANRIKDSKRAESARSTSTRFMAGRKYSQVNVPVAAAKGGDGMAASVRGLRREKSWFGGGAGREMETTYDKTAKKNHRDKHK